MCRVTPTDALILERLDGSQWSEDNNPNFSRAIKDVAVYYDRVSRLTFSGVGTLTPAGEPGPILHPNGSNLGPFRSLAEYHIASIDRALAGFHHGTHDHQRPRDILQTYLFNLEVRALVAADPNFAAQPTYLRHNDSHGGNWLVRESDGSLAGLIDWEFSYCTTFGDAFRAPEVLTGDNLGPLERRDPYDLNPPKLTSYEIALAAEYRSLGREDLATAVENADKFKMLEVTAERVPPDMTDMVRLRTAFTRISSPVDTASGAPAHAPAIKPASLPQSRNQWIAMTYARYGQHAGFQGMLRARQEWRNILCAAVQRAAEELEGKVSAVHWNDEEGEFDVQVDAEGGAEAEAD
jgi:hypothetical protein